MEVEIRNRQSEEIPSGGGASMLDRRGSGFPDQFRKVEKRVENLPELIVH